MSEAGTTPGTVGIGRKQAVLLLEEMSVGVLAGPTTGGTRMDVLAATPEESIDRIERTDKRQTPNIEERMTGKTAGSLEINGYAMAAAIGVAPDCAKLLKAAGYTETVNPGVSVVYAPGNTLTTLGVIIDSDNAGQIMHGVAVETLSIKVNGDGESMISFKARTAKTHREGTSTLAGVEEAEQTILSVIDAAQFEAGGYIQAGADNNSNAGYRVTAVNTGLNEITITPGLTTGANNGDVVGPCIPVLPTAGTPITGIAGTLTRNGVAIEVTEAEVINENTLDSNQAAYGADSYSRVLLVDRRVKFSATVYATRANLLQWLKSKGFGSASTVLVLGSTAPNRIEITMPKLEMDVANLDVPEVEQVMIKLSGIALKNVGNDEVSLKFSY